MHKIAVVFNFTVLRSINLKAALKIPRIWCKEYSIGIQLEQISEQCHSQVLGKGWQSDS